MLKSLFVALSENRKLRNGAEHWTLGQRVSRRFVAGTTIEDVLGAAARLNGRGFSVSADNLGENVSNVAEARQSAEVYHRLLDEIAARGLNSNVSLKLTHMGLDVDPSLARELVKALVTHAELINNFVRIDMEGSAYTQVTVDIVRELHALMPGRAGAVIQAYLRRSEADVEQLIAQGIRVRLCKGAYDESPELAFQEKSEVDANYLRLMKILLKSGSYHGIATHDPKIIAATQAFARSENISPDEFEFQMLYGIRRDLQEKIARDGWRMRVYVPFGPAWYPYLMRRMAERPANLWFVMKNLFRG
jgi:proline dehydrogenase